MTLFDQDPIVSAEQPTQPDDKFTVVGSDGQHLNVQRVYKREFKVDQAGAVQNYIPTGGISALGEQFTASWDNLTLAKHNAAGRFMSLTQQIEKSQYV